MFEPCVDHCYIRHGKQYSIECDDTCEYEKIVKEKKALEDQQIEGLEARKRKYNEIQSLILSGSPEYKRDESYIFFTKAELTKLMEIIKEMIK